VPQTGTSHVPFPTRSLDFSVDLIHPAEPMALGSIEPLTELSSRNCFGSKGSKADVTAIYKPIV
jgi:hypothetical protein